MNNIRVMKPFLLFFTVERFVSVVTSHRYTEISRPDEKNFFY